MKKSLWQLCVRVEFSAAHALRHYQGKCEALHGHNYMAEMCVQGQTLSSDTELMLDFSILKALLREAVATLDHCVINEKPPFDSINPSAENLARYLWRAVEPKLAARLAASPTAPPVHLYSMSVSEKSAQTATYREYSEPDCSSYAQGTDCNAPH